MWTIYMLSAFRQRKYTARSLCCQRSRFSPCWSSPCQRSRFSPRFNPAIEVLNLVAKICTINTDKETIVSRFPKLFSGLGCLTEEYEIQLSKDAVPHALTTPRRVSLPLMEPVKSELQRMEREGVITKVEGPTNWCAGMVVVPKPNKKVCICVDLTHLNKSVQRERHILPSVDHTLAQRTVGRSTILHQARCKFRLLAGAFIQRVSSFDNIYHAIRQILLQPFALWHFICA